MSNKKGSRKPSPSLREMKYKTISKDRPLTSKEEAFVFHYVGDCKQNATQAALAAGYSQRGAKNRGYELLQKPNVAYKIEQRLNDYFERLDITAFDVLQRIVDLGMAKFTDIAEIRDGGVYLYDTADMSERALASIAEVTESTMANGGSELKVKQRDSMPSLNMLFKLFRLDQSDYRAQRPRSSEQVEMLEAVLEGTKTATEAMLHLDMQGIPIPESILKLATKEEAPEEDVDDSGNFPTAEELNAAYIEKQKKIDSQKDDFLPKRREEVQSIKNKLSGKEAFVNGEKESKDNT
jgi:phage terminase small subunit